MVNIGTHKGKKIVYEEGMFNCDINGTKIERSSEQQVKDYIDELERKEKREKEETEKRKKELELAKNKEKVKIRVNRNDFLTFLTNCSHYSTEVQINVTKNKMSVTEMDPANVLMFNREMACKSNHDTKFWVKLGVLKGMLNHFHSKNDLELSFSINDKEDVLIVKGDGGIFEYLLPQNDLKEHKIPDLKFDAKFEFKLEHLYKELDQTGYSFDSIMINVTGKEVSFSNEDKKSEDIKLYFSKPYTIKKTGKATAKYSNEYLKKRFFKKGDLVTISLSKDYPLKIEDNKGNWIILAPRITEN